MSREVLAMNMFSVAAETAAGWQPTVEVAAVLAVKTLPEVIEGLRAWIMGILAAVATLFLVIGGLRYMTAAGDPAGVEQAKGSFKAALTGYALAVLAPVVLQVLQGILGG
jgi:Type IV secretion system pilin